MLVVRVIALPCRVPCSQRQLSIYGRGRVLTTRKRGLSSDHSRAASNTTGALCQQLLILPYSLCSEHSAHDQHVHLLSFLVCRAVELLHLRRWERAFSEQEQFAILGGERIIELRPRGRLGASLGFEQKQGGSLLPPRHLDQALRRQRLHDPL